MARMSDSLGPFGPGFFGRALEENKSAVLAAHQRLMEGQQRGRAQSDGDLANPSPDSEQAPRIRIGADRPL